MTPKEKAEDLVNKFIKLTSKHEKLETAGLGAITLAKQCALIAVDEIIQELDHLPFDDQDFGTFKMKYWQEVKKEIERL